MTKMFPFLLQHSSGKRMRKHETLDSYETSWRNNKLKEAVEDRNKALRSLKNRNEEIEEEYKDKKRPKF
uniref:Uncharacterized protein n=1 Tax=Timema monikensis TaxID=170555 RepID=A0A7R9HQ10_9NEOP|nr:unnamed protein product [Timema monikensis]